MLCLTFVSVRARAGDVVKTPIEQPAEKSVSDVMAANPRLSRWVAILKELKLWELLEESPPVTAFAPTNEAVAEVPKEKWDALKKNNEEYRRLVLYHFVKGRHPAKDLRAHGGPHPTLAGLNIDVKVDGKALVLWDGAHTANVLKHAAKASNGVVHVIDAVMIPPIPRM